MKIGEDSKLARTGAQIGMLLMALACPALVLADRSTSGELIISGSKNIIDAPTRIAAAVGHFDADTGPSIRVELADSGKQSLERLMAGEADFALMGATPLAMALVRLHNEGAPPETWPVVVASLGLSSNTHRIIVDARRGIEQPADLAGHALGVPFDTSAHFAWDQFADLHGIGANAVRLLDTRPGALAEGLAAGRLDAVVVWSPVSEQIMGQLGANARVFPLQSMDSVSWLLVCRRALLARQPQAVDRVLQGYAESIGLLQTEPDRAAALLNLPPELLQGKHAVWKLALNWPVIATMEANLEWSATRLEMSPLHGSPRLYIEPGPLKRSQPRAVWLPTWITAGKTER